MRPEHPRSARLTGQLVAATVLLALLLSACGAPAASAPTTAPTPPTSTDAPTAAPTPPTAPTPTATAAPTPAPASITPADPAAAAPTALYPCQAGLCMAALGPPARVLARFKLTAGQLAGYALAPDSSQIAYARREAAGSASVWLQPVSGGPARQLLTVTGAPSGLGDLEGYGVVGFASNQALVIEDQAQVVLLSIASGQRQPITPQLPYGASSTHRFALSADGAAVLFQSSGAPNSATIYAVANRTARTVTLPADQQVLGLFGDPAQLLVQRFTPPVDPNLGNPATVERTPVSYLIADADGKLIRELALDSGPPPTLISTLSGTSALLQHADGRLVLLDLASGRGAALDALPERSGDGRVVLAGR